MLNYDSDESIDLEVGEPANAALSTEIKMRFDDKFDGNVYDDTSHTADIFPIYHAAADAANVSPTYKEMDGTNLMAHLISNTALEIYFGM